MQRPSSPKRRRGTEIFNLAVLFFSVSLCFCGNAFSEESHSLIGSLKEDFTYIGSSPSRMDRKSALITAGIIGAGAILYTQDEKIRDYVQDHRSSTLDDIDPIAEKFGNGLYDLGFLAVFGGAGYILGNEKMKDTALLSFESFLVANTIGTAVKVSAGRTRPDDGEKSTEFTPFSFDSEHTSFPSGHTTSAFSIASVFAEQYESAWVDVTAYTLAAATGFQRIYDDAHWASDVFIGAVLGTTVGKSIVYLHKNRDMENVWLVPMSVPSEGLYGVMAVMRY